MTHKILVAEDDPNTRSALVELLQREGYHVVAAADGRQAQHLFQQHRPDLACLDVMLPGLSGYDLCREFRSASPRMPILFITAKAEEIDKVVGLELGADDYIVKPFGGKEVIARIRAVTRRCLPDSPSSNESDCLDDEFQMDDLLVVPKQLRAKREGTMIELTLREIKILQALANRPGEVVDRRDLFRSVWGAGHLPNSRTLDQTISQLRKRIELDPKQPRIIQTVYGVGYRFSPEL